jgi:hypothetical protein
MRPISIGVITLLLISASQGVAFAGSASTGTPGDAHWKNVCNTQVAPATSAKGQLAKKATVAVGGAKLRRSCVAPAVAPAAMAFDSTDILFASVVALDAVTVGVASTTGSPASP